MIHNVVARNWGGGLFSEEYTLTAGNLCGVGDRTAKNGRDAKFAPNVEVRTIE